MVDVNEQVVVSNPIYTKKNHTAEVQIGVFLKLINGEEDM